MEAYSYFPLTIPFPVCTNHLGMETPVSNVPRIGRPPKELLRLQVELSAGDDRNVCAAPSCVVLLCLNQGLLRAQQQMT